MLSDFSEISGDLKSNLSGSICGNYVSWLFSSVSVTINIEMEFLFKIISASDEEFVLEKVSVYLQHREISEFKLCKTNKCALRFLVGSDILQYNEICLQ